MNLANLSSSDLRQIAKLVEQRDKLQSQIDQINDKLSGYGTTTGGKRKGAARKSAGRPKKRGQLKEGVIATLKAAGKTGVTAREIADKLGTKPVNIHAWFHSTGKKVKGIEKIDGGKYRMK